MLIINIPETEAWDEKKEEFVKTKAVTLKLEHSLVSISKWEAKFNKPFLHSTRSNSEIVEYIKCMAIGSEIQNETLSCLTSEHFDEIAGYINAPMSATWFNETNTPKSREIITSELIYYWMIAYNIPFECQKWHLNRLLTLIRVCGIKTEQQTGKKKMRKSEIISMNQSLNAQRRAKLNSRG